MNENVEVEDSVQDAAVNPVKMFPPLRAVEVVQVERANAASVELWVESHGGKAACGNRGVEISFKDYSSGEAVHMMEYVFFGDFVSVDNGKFLNIGDASNYKVA